MDKSQWIVIRNTHERIVTQEEFDRANTNMRDVVQAKRIRPQRFRDRMFALRADAPVEEEAEWCPTWRMHQDSPCSEVRIRRDMEEWALVELVRTQAQLLVTEEQMRKET